MNDKNWTKEQTLERLKRVHDQETELGKRMSVIDKETNRLNRLLHTQEIRRQKLQKLVSSNMRYRNELINLL